MQKPVATIIIPAYNEEKKIRSILSEMLALNKPYEIIVINDGSTDRTGEVSQIQGIKVIHQPYNKGYGAALKTGIRNASADIVVTFDADGQHNPGDIERLLEHLGEYDMVVGKRTKDSYQVLYRQPGKIFLSLVANYLVEKKIPDVNSGLRALKRNLILRHLHLLPNSFSFSTTCTLLFFKEGYNVNFIPIKVIKRVSKSTVRVRHGLQTFLLIVRIIVLFNPLKVFAPVASILFLIGLFSFVYELVISRNLGDFPILFIISGIIIFFFGILADQTSALRRERRDDNS